jgi:peroxiredoxin
MVNQIKDKFRLVGSKIQEFELPNSRGTTVNIRDLENKKNIIIVLFRGISWPYCRWHAARLRKDLEKFEELDGYLYTIMADNEKNAKKMEEKYARKYPVFYDETKKVPKLLKQEIRLLKLGRMPGLLVVDKKGIIQYAYYGKNMHDIPENEEIIGVLRRINKNWFGRNKIENKNDILFFKVSQTWPNRILIFCFIFKD